MGGDILDLPSQSDNQDKQSFSYSKVFDQCCPYFMSIGMTYEEYWFGPSELTRYAREAYRLRRKQIDEEQWMQGRYIYDAIGALAPILRTNLSNKEVSAGPYVDKPYLEKLEEEKKDAETKETEEAVTHQTNMLAFMQDFASKWNHKRKEDAKLLERLKKDNNNMEETK